MENNTSDYSDSSDDRDENLEQLRNTRPLEYSKNYMEFKNRRLGNIGTNKELRKYIDIRRNLDNRYRNLPKHPEDDNEESDEENDYSDSEESDIVVGDGNPELYSLPLKSGWENKSNRTLPSDFQYDKSQLINNPSRNIGEHFMHENKKTELKSEYVHFCSSDRDFNKETLHHFTVKFTNAVETFMKRPVYENNETVPQSEHQRSKGEKGDKNTNGWTHSGKFYGPFDPLAAHGNIVLYDEIKEHVTKNAKVNKRFKNIHKIEVVKVIFPWLKIDDKNIFDYAPSTNTPFFLMEIPELHTSVLSTDSKTNKAYTMLEINKDTINTVTNMFMEWIPAFDQTFEFKPPYNNLSQLTFELHSFNHIKTEGASGSAEQSINTHLESAVKPESVLDGTPDFMPVDTFTVEHLDAAWEAAHPHILDKFNNLKGLWTVKVQTHDYFFHHLLTTKNVVRFGHVRHKGIDFYEHDGTEAMVGENLDPQTISTEVSAGLIDFTAVTGDIVVNKNQMDENWDFVWSHLHKVHHPLWEADVYIIDENDVEIRVHATGEYTDSESITLKWNDELHYNKFIGDGIAYNGKIKKIYPAEYYSLATTKKILEIADPAHPITLEHYIHALDLFTEFFLQDHDHFVLFTNSTDDKAETFANLIYIFPPGSFNMHTKELEFIPAYQHIVNVLYADLDGGIFNQIDEHINHEHELATDMCFAVNMSLQTHIILKITTVEPVLTII